LDSIDAAAAGCGALEGRIASTAADVQLKAAAAAAAAARRRLQTSSLSDVNNNNNSNSNASFASRGSYGRFCVSGLRPLSPFVVTARTCW